VSARDEAFLRTHAWPGNVRELRNSAERFVLNAGVGRQSLESLVTGNGTEFLAEDRGTLRDLMDGYERSVLANSVRRHDGRMADVMKELGVPRRTLNEKMTRLGLTRPKALIDDE